MLHLYREINLIYSFSEKLAALLDVERVAELTLREARHLIVATDGALMLLDEASGSLSMVAGFGDELPALTGFRRGVGILGAIAASGVGRDRQRRGDRPATGHTGHRRCARSSRRRSRSASA